MQKSYFEVHFTNGSESRRRDTWQPDHTFAMREAQQRAWDIFSLPWNRVADQRKWKIIVIRPNCERYEEPFVIPLPVGAANTY